MKKSGINIVILAVMLIFIGILMVPAISGRVKNDTDEFRLKAATEAFEENKTHNFIPGTRGYYYLGFTTDNQVVIFKASIDWFNDNFDKSGYAKDEEGVLVKGTVEEFSDKQQQEADFAFENMEMLGWKEFKYDRQSCLNLLSNSFFVKAIIASVLTLVVGILVIIGICKNWFDSKYIILLFIAVVVCLLYFGLHVILGR